MCVCVSFTPPGLLYSLPHSLNHSLTHLLFLSDRPTHSLTISLPHQLTHSLNYLLTNSHNYSLTHSFTHTLTHISRPPSLTLSLTPLSLSLSRPLAYSILADLVHHIRTFLTLGNLSLAVHVFSSNVHDDTLPVSIQTMSCKLLLNLVESIRIKAEQEPSVSGTTQEPLKLGELQ